MISDATYSVSGTMTFQSIAGILKRGGYLDLSVPFWWTAVCTRGTLLGLDGCRQIARQHFPEENERSV